MTRHAPKLPPRRTPIAARIAVIAAVFAALQALLWIFPPLPGPNVSVVGAMASAALLATGAQSGFVVWNERLPNRTTLQPYARVAAISVAAGASFVLWAATTDGDTSPRTLWSGAFVTVAGLALGLADRWVWRRSRSDRYRSLG